MKKIVMVVLALGLAGPAHGLDLKCMPYRPVFNDRSVERPAMPACLQDSQAFATALEREQCLGALQQYQRDLQSYFFCLESEADAAIAEFNTVLEGFRQRRVE